MALPCPNRQINVPSERLPAIMSPARQTDHHVAAVRCQTLDELVKQYLRLPACFQSVRPRITRTRRCASKTVRRSETADIAGSEATVRSVRLR
jgi:hypothetical protein